MFSTKAMLRARKTAWVLVGVVSALVAGQAVGASYFPTVDAQNPFEYYRVDTLNGENGGTLVQNGVSIDQNAPSPTLNQTGGFPGLMGNSWGNFPGTPSSALTSEDGGWNSDAGTISFFARPATSGGHSTRTMVFARESGATGTFSGGTNQALGIFTRTSGSWGIFLDNEGVDISSTSVPLNEWHHLAFTWQRNTGAADGEIRAYFDGVEAASDLGASWNSFTMANDGRFGKEITNGTRVYAGSMDEIGIWTRALSPTEIAAQFNAAVLPEPTTMLIWSLLAGLGIGLGWRRKR